MFLRNIILPFSALVVLIFFLYHSQNFKLDASSDTLILQNDEDFKFFNYYNDIFPSKNFLVLAIKSENEIDRKYIEKIKEIKSKLSKIESIESVFSIIDSPILLSNNIKLTDLQNNIETINNTDIDLNIIINEFSNSPIFSNQIISENKKISSLILYIKKDIKFENIKDKKNNITINDKDSQVILSEYRELKKTNNIYRKKLINDVRSIINHEKKNTKNYSFYLGGIDMIIDDTITFVKKDIIVFSISVFIFIFITLYIIFREIKWVIIPLTSTIYSIIIMIGLIGYLNWEITAISSNFISLMLILSISMCIHIINNYRFNYNQKKEAAIKSTLKKMVWPCFYTALTTIVAFCSLLLSDIKPVIDFGKIMIIALSIIFITSFTILPLIISIFPKINSKTNIKFKLLNIFYYVSTRHNIKIYLINIIIFSISIFGIYNLNVENSFINYFKKNTDIHQGMKIIDQNLGGTTPLDIIIKFHENNNEISNNIDEDIDELEDLEINDDIFFEEENNTWFTEDKLSTIKNIHNFLESKKEIGKVLSIYSLIDMAEKINRNDLTIFELSILYNQIPENYKNDLIKPYLSIENNMVKFSARVKDSDQIKRQDLIEEIKFYLNNNNFAIKEAEINGLLVLYNNMLQSLFSSQIKSFGFVLLAIFIMFLILFRSFKISIVGIIPNIFACSFILGFMGIAKIPLDIMTITVAAITIGIAVDNTIHYLYKTKNNISNKMDIKDALNDSHKSVGQAVLTTSLTIAFGFSVLCLSNFVPTILFGLFTAIAMIIAMLGVLITLPAGLVKIKL